MIQTIWMIRMIRMICGSDHRKEAAMKNFLFVLLMIIAFPFVVLAELLKMNP